MSESDDILGLSVRRDTQSKVLDAVDRKMRSALRRRAQAVYLTDPELKAIGDLKKNPEFAKVSRKTLERWAREDNWVEEKQKSLDKVIALAKRRLGSVTCQAAQQELEDLIELRQLTLDRLRDELTMPKSYEGVLKAFLDLGRRRGEVTSEIGAELTLGATQAPDEIAAQFDERELQELAKTALRHRREQFRGELAAINETNQTGEDEKRDQTGAETDQDKAV